MTTLISTTTFAAGWSTAKKPQSFTSVMTPSSIDAAVISTSAWPIATPAGSNNWPIMDIVDGKPAIVGWIVDSRSVYANLTGNLQGAGIFTYGGILDTEQSGSMQGDLVVNTGGLNAFYMAASGKLNASVTEYYDFPGIAAWCQGQFPVGAFFSQVYNAPQLALLPDGNLTFAQLQAFCTANGITTGQFFAGVTGNTALASLPDEAISPMYGTVLPILSGLQILGGMYGSTLPSLPKTMNADFSGTLNVESGTGIYSGANGQGTFGPYKRIPLTLHVTPAQHVQSIDGSIQISGTYSTRTFNPRKPDLDKFKNQISKWKDYFGPGKGFDNNKLNDAVNSWNQNHGK